MILLHNLELAANKLISFEEVTLLAHELRQPLTVLKGMTQAMLHSPQDEECLVDFKMVVPQELDRLSRLLESLLKVGRMPEPVFVPVDLNHLLENLIKLFNKCCIDAHIKIRKNFGALPSIPADPDQLSRLFINLMVNAVQAMPEGGELSLTTIKKRQRLMIEVSDTGAGISKKDLKNIFQPFYSGKKEGLGLGLALAKKIIRHHKGRLFVASEIGQGTQFTISLPLTA